MTKIEEVTKILERWFKDPIDSPCPYCEASKEILELLNLNKPQCPHCKSDHSQKSGKRRQLDKIIQRYWCYDCGHIFYLTTEEKGQ